MSTNNQRRRRDTVEIPVQTMAELVGLSFPTDRPREIRVSHGPDYSIADYRRGLSRTRTDLPAVEVR